MSERKPYPSDLSDGQWALIGATRSRAFRVNSQIGGRLLLLPSPASLWPRAGQAETDRRGDENVGGSDYLELLPVRWQAITPAGITELPVGGQRPRPPGTTVHV
ncbi:hypothetical protein ACGFNV_35510 [Streptomyces sp. NPDC048751]|uniref:hypothetical protein n=1 Tax=Streptomyces sp. NPDC048751 TaxID=3365591 RepID=UPI00371F167A